MFAEVIQRKRSCGSFLRGFHWQGWKDKQESLLILILCPLLSTFLPHSILETCIPEKICNTSCCCHRKPHRRPWPFHSSTERMSRGSTTLQLVCFRGIWQLGWVEQCSALTEKGLKQKTFEQNIDQLCYFLKNPLVIFLLNGAWNYIEITEYQIFQAFTYIQASSSFMMILFKMWKTN